MNNQSSSALKIINIADYKKSKRINKSGFGVIYNAEEKKTGNIYTVKIIDCDDDEEKANKMISKKTEDILALKHKTLVNIIGYSKIDFQEENNIVIMMESAKNGSLSNIIKSFQEKNVQFQYSNTNRQIIIAGIAKGMKMLHDKNIIHGDLKSNNILLDESFKPIITDFYLTNLIEKGKSLNQAQFSGNIPYLSPERISNFQNGKKDDVYAFGILVFEILNDSFAYPELLNGKISDLEFRNKVVHDNYRPTFNKYISQSLKQLIERCISSDPNERPDFDEIFYKIAFSSNNESDSKSNNYLLDNVDIKTYTEYINEITDPQEQLLNQISNIKDEYLKKITSIEKENQVLKQDIKNLQNKNEENLKKISSCIKDKERMYNGNVFLKDENQNYIKQITKLRDENRKLNMDIKLLKEENQEQHQKNNKLKEENNKLKEENNKLGEKIHELSMYVDSCLAEEKKLRDSFELFINSILISHFNILDFKMQQVVMEALSNSTKISLSNKSFFKKINDTLGFLRRLGDLNDSCIKVLGDDEKRLINISSEIPIMLKYNATNIYFKSSKFILDDMINNLKVFNEFRIELEYPQSSFNELYENAVKVRKSDPKKFFLSIYVPCAKEIDTYFRGNTDISYVTLSKSVIKLNNSESCGPFEYCSSLVQIIIPDSVTFIGNYAFNSCTSLTEITIPSNVEKISKWSFKNCSKLTKVSIPFSVQIINNEAFYACTSLTEIDIPSSIKYIEEKAFQKCTKLKKINMSQRLKYIEPFVFNECSSLTYIKIPKSVTIIKEEAFSGCTSLVRIEFDFMSELANIEKYAFKNCTSLQEFTFPSNLTEVGEGTFLGCSSLTTITKPYSIKLKKIDKYAFKNCISLNSIDIFYEKIELGDNVFDGCTSLKTIYLNPEHYANFNLLKVGLQSDVKIGKKDWLEMEWDF